MKKFKTISLSIFLVVLFITTNVSYAYNINKHWDNTPLNLYYSMSSTFSTDGKSSFSYANTTWNNVSNADIDIWRLSTDNSATDFNQNSSNEVFKADAGAVGLMTTATYYSGGYAVEFDIRVNTYYTWSNSGQTGKYDVQNCATHEIGHVLFSGDITSKSQVQSAYQSQWTDVTMYYTAATGETKKRTLHQDDKDGFVAAY